MYYRHLQEDAAQEDETEEDRYRFRSLQEQHVGGDMKIHGFETPKSVDRKLNFYSNTSSIIKYSSYYCKTNLTEP